NGHIRDQLKRAATSIPLNLAEGSGKMSNKDKLRFYAIARGSAMECAAICDVLVLTEPRLKNSAEAAKERLEQIARILTTICSKN
ncbi:MAG: four helix bundle protein, partial [Bdellovibrionales bacterium]|nr:four helix bundle protein [Bdellovibrionales bacterium]